MQKQLEYIKQKLQKSFDVKYREVDTVAGKATLIFIDDLCSTEFISDYIVSPLKDTRQTVNSVDEVMSKALNINIVGLTKDLDDAVFHILSGDVCILFDDYEEIIFCETKGFVRRGVGIPVTEAVLKGPREGFAEAFVDNVALIRRRIKNANLKFEPVYVGSESKTVVCITYIEGIVPEDLIKNVKDTVESLDYKFILDTNYIEGELRDKKTIFDTVGYTEKADEVCAKILEGRVAIIVDGTPFVITVPFFFLENFQSPDDYYTNRYFANFTRILRWSALFISTILPALYVAIITHHFAMIPSMFIFRLAVSRAGVPFSLVTEVVVMMLFFQLIKEAGLRLPQPIGSAMSIVSALILGDSAVGAGLASNITILVVAISTLSYFLIPKVYGAVSVWAIGLVFAAGAFGLPGVFIACMILLSHLANLQSCGYPYLFPLATLKAYGFDDIFTRGDLRKISKNIIKEGDKGDVKEKNS